MKKFVKIMMVAAIGLMVSGQVRAADEYWRTDGTSGGTWTSTYWSNPASAAGGTGWTSGNNAVFTANSTLTFATATIGNVTVSNNATVVVTQAGTLTLGGVRTFDVESGSTLTWSGQSQSTSAGNEGAGIIKNGGGTLSLGAGPGSNVRYDGGFTLNAGTVIVSGKYVFGTGPLAINGGTISSSGGNNFSSGAITIGGNFTFSGTGNDAYTNSTISLGATTSTITNSSSGIRLLCGVISGNAGIGLSFAGSGSGTINITNAYNSFSGPITINGGEVQFANDGSFGATSGSAVTNAIVLDGGRLTAADGAGNAVSFTLNANRGIQVGSTAGTSISVVSGGSLTYNGIIADKTGSTGILVKQGKGTLALGAVSTYSGTTAINNGTLQLTTGNNRLPTGTLLSIGQSASNNRGTLDLNGNNQQVAGLNSTFGTTATAKNTVTNSNATASILTIGGSGAYAFGDGSTTNSGVIAGAITLVMSGSGTQTLGDTNTYTGGTFINNGKVSVSADNNLGDAAGQVTINAGTLDVQSSFGSTRQIAVSNVAAAISVGSTYAYTNSTGIIGNGGLTKNGAGTLTISGGNTYSGGTTVGNGTLQLGASGALPSAQAVTVSGGTLDLNGYNPNAAAVALTSGTISGAGALTGTSFAVQSGTISSVLAGGGALIKSTANTVTLSGANTYSGGTLISNGALDLSGSGTLGSGKISITSSGALDLSQLSSSYTLGSSGNASVLTNYGAVAGGLSIGSGALVTGGGHFSGSVTNQANGMLTPGVGGDTNFFSNLTLNGGSTNSFYLASVSTHDMSVVTNGVTYGANHPLLNLNLADWTTSSGTFVLYDDLSGSAPAWDGTSQTFQLADQGGTYDGRLLTNGASFLALGGGSTPVKFTINYNYAADSDLVGNDIALTVIPEPASMSMLAVLGAAFWMRQRFRRPSPRPHTL